MKIDIGQKNLTAEQKQALQSNPQRTGKVTVSPNPVKQSIRIDIDGNEIDPRTKKIIRLEKDVH